MNGTQQTIIVVFMAGGRFSIRSLPVTDGGYEVEGRMIGIGADHAVGVGEMVEEAAGWIILPDKGSLQLFYIHPEYATFPVIVKMGVLHGASAKHQAAAGRTPQGIVFFLEAPFHGSKGSLLNDVAVSIIEKFPDAGGIMNGNHLSKMVVGKLPSWRTVIVGHGDKFSSERSICICCHNAS